jgi:hypothetical protein
MKRYYLKGKDIKESPKHDAKTLINLIKQIIIRNERSK